MGIVSHRPMRAKVVIKGGEMSRAKEETTYTTHHEYKEVIAELRIKAEAYDTIVKLVKAWETSKTKFRSEGEELIDAIRIIVLSIEE